MSAPRRVIAVSGPVGAGKTTLVGGLATALRDSTIVRFDHYEQLTERPIENIRNWLREGADLDAIEIPGLAADLAALKAGRTVTDPATRGAVQPAKYILFETQFGRRHAATGAEVDLLVWLDLPLDMALARKLRQFSTDPALHEPTAAARYVRWLREYLDNYLAVVGDLLRMQRDRVAADADLVLDGRAAPQAVLREAERVVRARFE